MPNVYQNLGVEPGIRSDGTPTGAAFATAIDRLNARGGRLYVPPGRYLLDFAEGTGFRENFRLERQTTLSFAPGAVLLIDPSMPLIISGGIEAQPFPIFGDAAYSGSPSHPPRPGAVRFEGNRVRELYPEWFGAFSDPAADSTLAIQAVLDAAVALLSPERATMTVTFCSSYGISAPLVLGSRELLAPSVQGGVLLRGSSFGCVESVDDATIHWIGAQSTSEMLTIRAAIGSTLENISFHGNRIIDICVRIDAAPQTIALPATVNLPARIISVVAEGHLFSGCSFRGARRQLVVIDDGDFYARALSANQNLTSDLLEGLQTLDLAYAQTVANATNLMFDGCSFRADPPTDKELSLKPNDAPISTAVVLRASSTVGVQFVNSLFEGHARAMIHAYGSRFFLRHCAFQNLREPSGSDEDHLDAVDIVLDVPSSALIKLPAASFTAEHCDSRSLCFLVASVDQEASVVPGGQVVLTNLLHSTQTLRRAIPALFWNRHNTTNQQASLLLVGCHFSGNVVLGMAASSVIDIDTCFLNTYSTFVVVSGDDGIIRTLQS